MIQEILEARRKKKKKKVIIVDDLNIDEESEEIEKILKDKLTKKIIEALRHHVGDEKSITKYEIFVKVFDESPENFDLYKRLFFWNEILKRLHVLRKHMKMFVINKGKLMFILKTKSEAEYFKKRIDNTIKALKTVKDKADEWVDKEGWKEFE